MLKKSIKLIIAGLLLLGAIYLFIKGLVGSGVLTVLVSGIFVLLHFKNEKNLIAFYFVRKSKFQAAESILNRVKHPENMVKSQEAYFYYLSGLIATQKHENSKADKLFKKSLKSGLRMKTDQAVAKLNLSAIALTQRNKKVASYYLQECKKLDDKKMLAPQIKEIEGVMKRI